MSVVSRTTGWSGAHRAGAEERRSFDRSAAQEARQFRWMVAACFLLLLVPATIASLSGWRWRPWPPGREGYRSILGEAKEAAQTYVVFAFRGL